MKLMINAVTGAAVIVASACAIAISVTLTYGLIVHLLRWAATP